MFVKSLKRYGRIAICLLALLFSGCSQLVPTPDPVSITFVYPEYNDVALYETWVQQFNELYPYITVELVSTEGLTFDQIAEKNTFTASQFELPQLQAQDAVMSLDSFIEQDEALNLDDFYPGALEVFTNEGRRWAIPSGIDIMMMYYNKDLFDQYGVAYPQLGWTWGDFLDRAIAVNNPSNDVFGYALQYEGDFAIYEPLILIYQHGGRIFDDLQAPTQVTLDDPLNIEAMEFYASLIYDHRVAPAPGNPLLRQRPYPWRGVYEGRFAMWMLTLADQGGGRWGRGWDINWGIVPLPRDQNAVTMGTVDGLFISSQTAHPEECWLWIKFVSQQMPYFLMPARRSMAESNEYETKVGAEVAIAARTAVEEAILVNPELLGFETALAAMQQAFQAIRGAEVTPAEALDAAQRQSGF